jgi:hypothetical protein
MCISYADLHQSHVSMCKFCLLNVDLHHSDTAMCILYGSRKEGIYVSLCTLGADVAPIHERHVLMWHQYMSVTCQGWVKTLGSLVLWWAPLL